MVVNEEHKTDKEHMAALGFLQSGESARLLEEKILLGTAECYFQNNSTKRTRSSGSKEKYYTAPQIVI